MTLGDLAEATNIPYGYLADLEENPGLLSTLRLDRALILSEELGVPASEFLSESRIRPQSDAQVVFRLVLDRLPAALPMHVFQTSDWPTSRLDVAIDTCNEILMGIGAKLRRDKQALKLATAQAGEIDELMETFRTSEPQTDAFGDIRVSQELTRLAYDEVSVPVDQIPAAVTEQLIDEGVWDRIGNNLWLSSSAIAALGLERESGYVLAEQGFKARAWSEHPAHTTSETSTSSNGSKC